MAEDNSKRYYQFDGTNYSNWKYRVQTVLEEKDLIDYIKKDLVAIMAGASEQEKKAHEKNERKCKLVLVQHVADSHLEYIKDKTTAKEMFDALRAVFERKSIAGQLWLRKKLITLKYVESNNIADHFLEFDKTVRELKSIGANLEDLDVICHLLLTLPKSFDSLVTALETLNPEQLTMEFVRSRLLDEYSKRNSVSTETGKREESVAMNVEKFKFKCYKCGKLGHKRSECRAKNEKNGGKIGGKKQAVHMAADDRNEIAFSAATSLSASITPPHDKHDNSRARVESIGKSDKQFECVKFYLDSGATDHMVNSKNILEHIERLSVPVNIAVAKNDITLHGECVGKIKGYIQSDRKRLPCSINNVLFVKDLKCNLLSIRRLEDAGFEITFKNSMAMIVRNGIKVATAVRTGKLYELEVLIEKGAFVGATENKGDMQVWHRRMGHLNNRDMEKLVRCEMVVGLPGLSTSSGDVCEPCIFGKQTRKPFPKVNESRSTRPLELIHSDVCGPIDPVAWNGAKYFVSFIDDYTHFSVLYVIKQKSEVFEKFKEYVALSTAKFNTKISVLIADNGGEYTSERFKAYCARKGIQLNYTVPYSPEQNGVAERFNRTIIERARTMIFSAGLKKCFWNEAIQTANYLVNRNPTNALRGDLATKTPAELWYGKKPNVKNIRIFGSIAYCHVPKEKRKKLDMKATKTVLMGFAPTGYRLWNAERRQIFIGRDVTFDESVCLAKIPTLTDTYEEDVEVRGGNHLMKDTKNSSRENNVETSDTETAGSKHILLDEAKGNNQESSNEETVGQFVPRRSERERKPPSRYGDCFTHNLEADTFCALSAEQYAQGTPMSLTEAKESSDWLNWKEAIVEELKSLERNLTWTLTHLPKEQKPIRNKWVFRVKLNSKGNVERFKARLVAKGFSQRKGFDYNETYAPVAKLTTFRVLLALANHESLYIHQMDVKTAFLNGKLEEDVYMLQPEGFETGNKVCKLNRALYGLKQSPRMWNERFHQFITGLGMKQCQSDHCLYTQIEKSSKLFLLLYVDDVIIISNNLERIHIMRDKLSQEFEMTDLGELRQFLGMWLERDIQRKTMKINQRQYLEKLLMKFEMSNCKPTSTPMEVKLKLESDGGDASRKPYKELIGCLMYVTLTTRPDLCAAANYFSRFQSNFTDEHFLYAKRMLRYIRGTTDYGLKYSSEENTKELIGYADADWAGDSNDRKSTSGYVFKLYGCTISWLSRKQSTVSLSSTEAEYVALNHAACEAMWLRNLLAELGYKQEKPTVIYEDNQACIKISEEPREHKRMKHIDVKYNFIREVITNGFIQIKYLPSAHQLADIMTKSLPVAAFERLRDNLGVTD